MKAWSLKNRLALVLCAATLYLVYRNANSAIYATGARAASDIVWSGPSEQLGESAVGGNSGDQVSQQHPAKNLETSGKANGPITSQVISRHLAKGTKVAQSAKPTATQSTAKAAASKDGKPVEASQVKGKQDKEDQIQQDQIQKYIKSILAKFDSTSPDSVPKLSVYKDGKHAPLKAFDDPLPIFTKEELSEFLQVPANDKLELQKSHTAFVRSLPNQPPSSEIFRGTGVVIVSGGKFLPMALVGVRLIRQHSPSVPIEIFVQDKSEYEQGLCENVLWPEYRVRCRVLTDYFPESFMKKYEIHQYQLKIMALLASSFDNTLLLDSDNIPLHNLEHLFTNEPFTSTKYVLWPDYWFRVTSPDFYDIVQLEPGDRVRGNLSETDSTKIPLHDRKNTLPDKSTESGQVLVQKSSHYKSLLLTLYYNVHGYKYYYPLLSQGSIGEGDKETFLAGAVALGEYPYQVKQGVRPLGYHDDGFHGEGMLQADAVQDYNRQIQLDGLTEQQAKEKIKEDESENIVPGLFAHFNMLKLNMRMMFEVEGEHLRDDSKRRRYCGSPTSLGPLVQFQDIELIMWQACQWTVCELPGHGHTPKDWANTDVAELCRATTAHVKWLKSTHGS